MGSSHSFMSTDGKREKGTAMVRYAGFQLPCRGQWPVSTSESPLELLAALLIGWPHLLFCLGMALVYTFCTGVIMNPAPFHCPEWTAGYPQLLCPLVIGAPFWLLLSCPNSSSSPQRGKGLRAGPSSLDPQGEDCRRNAEEWSESTGLGLRRWPWTEKGSLETSLTRLLPRVFHKCSVEYLCNVVIDHK